MRYHAILTKNSRVNIFILAEKNGRLRKISPVIYEMVRIVSKSFFVFDTKVPWTVPVIQAILRRKNTEKYFKIILEKLKRKSWT